MSDLTITNFTMGSLPNVSMTRQEFANAIAELLTGQLTGSFLPGQEGGAQPTSDIGPWHPAGQPYFEFWSSALGKYVVSAFVPTGVIALFAGAIAPDGWLLCDGSAVGQSAQPALFTAIGYGYSLPGTDGSQTADTTQLTAASQFRLPDFRGRVAVGAGSGTANNTGGTNSLTPRNIGDRLGQETITIKAADMPEIDFPVFDYSTSTPPVTQGTVAAYGGYNWAGAQRTAVLPAGEGGATATPTNNMPPFGVAAYIIRT